MQRRMPRVEQLLLPVLRSEFPEVMFCTWIPDVDKRTYPLVNVRRVSGSAMDVELLDRATVQIDAYTSTSMPDTSDLYYDVRQAIWDMWKNQLTSPLGSISSFSEITGPTQSSSEFDDTFRVFGMIHLGVRPAPLT